jgi:DNA invertase Pin-like site-specific DNA recombinase
MDLKRRFQNDYSKLLVMEIFKRKMILQRQRESTEIAKTEGLYRGNKVGTLLNKENFLNNTNSSKNLNYLSKGYEYNEIGRIIGCSYFTS